MAMRAARFSETRFAFVDVETTGMDPLADRVVELACVVTRAGRRLESYSTLINPERPIPAPASAVHHLTDDCVAQAPSLEVVVPCLRELVADAVVVAHNAAFDLAFLPFLRERPTLCSMRFARIAAPEAPNHKNQVLRYHLGVRDPALSRGSAHGAPGDAIVTSLVFDECARRYLTMGSRDDVPLAIRAAMAPHRLRALPFGKHRGKPIGDVPVDYLRWLLIALASDFLDVRHTARTELERRGAVRSRRSSPDAALAYASG